MLTRERITFPYDGSLCGWLQMNTLGIILLGVEYEGIFVLAHVVDFEHVIIITCILHIANKIKKIPYALVLVSSCCFGLVFSELRV